MFLKYVSLAVLISFGPFAWAQDSGLKNFHKVSEVVYRGARPTDEGVKELKKMGIKTIINLQGGDISWVAFEPGEAASAIAHEKSMAQGQQLQFFNLPLSSTKEITVGSAADQRIRQVVKLMADPANQPVFVHCEQGVDRTGLVVALYRVWIEKMSAEKAYKEMQDMGHSGFAKRLLTSALDDYFEEVMDN